MAGKRVNLKSLRRAKRLRRWAALGLEQVRIAPRSPWQSPYVERLIGSVRRDCLDHVIVLNQTHLHRVLESYFTYYHASRTHLGLDKDAPQTRRVQPPEEGKIVAFPQVGGRIIAMNGEPPENSFLLSATWSLGPEPLSRYYGRKPRSQDNLLCRPLPIPIAPTTS